MIELQRIKDKATLTIEERVALYKKIFKDSGAVEPVRAYLQAGVRVDRLEELEAIRELNTTLTELYRVSIPVIT